MSKSEPPTPERPYDYSHFRLRLRLLAGLAVILLGTPAMVVVAVMSRTDWAFISALVIFTAGLLTVGGIIAPGRSSFHAGTKIWQNDGIPGGGGGAGGI